MRSLVTPVEQEEWRYRDGTYTLQRNCFRNYPQDLDSFLPCAACLQHVPIVRYIIVTRNAAPNVPRDQSNRFYCATCYPKIEKWAKKTANK